jgi:hypothetical protein
VSTQRWVSVFGDLALSATKTDDDLLCAVVVLPTKLNSDTPAALLVHAETLLNGIRKIRHDLARIETAVATFCSQRNLSAALLMASATETVFLTSGRAGVALNDEQPQTFVTTGGELWGIEPNVDIAIYAGNSARSFVTQHWPMALLQPGGLRDGGVESGGHPVVVVKGLGR